MRLAVAFRFLDRRETARNRRATDFDLSHVITSFLGQWPGLRRNPERCGDRITKISKNGSGKLTKSPASFSFAYAEAYASFA
jgi:hypothetical protein